MIRMGSAHWKFAVLGIATVAVVVTYATWSSESSLGRDPATAHIDPNTRRAALEAARRTWEAANVDAFIKSQRELTQAEPMNAEHWRILAEAHLERAYLHGKLRGMEVGRPTYSTLPEPVQQHLDLSEAALQRARELGDATSESYRIEAALTTMRVTGVATALRLDGAVRRALETSIRLDPHNPHTLVALACRDLFKPRWVGGDPERAKRNLLAVAEATPDDERPLMFASMAAYLLGDSEEALALMRACHACNPNHRYAEVVAQRLAAGEEDPFGRDVE